MESYTTSPATPRSRPRVIPFGGKTDVLSNFYPCQIEVYGIRFPSAEHAYQYSKAMMCEREDIAANIYDASTAWKAKQLSHRLMTTQRWETEKFSIMEDIIRAKSYHVKEFHDILLKSEDALIVEAVPGNLIWSCGLSKKDAVWYHPDDWPGQNRLGQIHMLIRSELQRELQWDI